MKKLLAVLTALSLALWGAALAEGEVPDAPEGTGGEADTQWLAIPEIPEIAVPELSDPDATEAPKIEVPEIPEIELPRVDIPWYTDPAFPVPKADAADGIAPEEDEPGVKVDGKAAEMGTVVPGELLDALGRGAFRETSAALLDGEVVRRGSKGDTAKGVQQTLVAFGQDISIDGNVGPKTLAALNAVQASFGLKKTDSLDAAGYAALLPGLLTVVHPEEADALLPGSLGSEYDYIRGCALELQGKYYSAKKAFEAGKWGDWEARAEACVQARPKTGQLYKNPDVKGDDARLALRYDGEGEAALLVKVRTAEGEVARTLFIKGSGKADTSLPAGSYLIEYGVGIDWYGEAEAFGPGGRYATVAFPGGGRALALEKGDAITLTVTAGGALVGEEGAATEDEAWERFCKQ